MDITHIFIGLIFVGVGLTLKIVSDSFRQIDQLKQKQAAFDEAAEQYRAQLVEEEAKTLDTAETVEDLRNEVKSLQAKEKQIAKKIGTRQKDRENHNPTKYKVQLK